MKNKELITALDEELMLKKSDALKREFFKEEQEEKMSFTKQVWTEIDIVKKNLDETECRTDMSFESAEYAERQARQAKILSILALAVSAITAIINIFIFCMR